MYISFQKFSVYGQPTQRAYERIRLSGLSTRYRCSASRSCPVNNSTFSNASGVRVSEVCVNTERFFFFILPRISRCQKKTN